MLEKKSVASLSMHNLEIMMALGSVSTPWQHSIGRGGAVSSAPSADGEATRGERGRLNGSCLGGKPMRC